MISTMLVYEVRNGCGEEVRAAIHEFVEAITETEPVFEHEAYQANESGQFAHFLSFPDREAESRHRGAAYTKKFLNRLQPCCTIQPVYRELATVTGTPAVQRNVRKEPTRAEFLKAAALVATWAAFWQMGCADDKSDGGSENPPPDPMSGPDCLNAGTIVSIGANHGHVLTVSKADVAAGTTRSYDISGSSGHSHLVTLSSAHFSSLAANQQVVVSSTTGGGHTHTVTVTCASA